MQHGQLLSHVDTGLVTREQLALVETPSPTRSFKPVAHLELTDSPAAGCVEPLLRAICGRISPQECLESAQRLHRSRKRNAHHDPDAGYPGARAIFRDDQPIRRLTPNPRCFLSPDHVLPFGANE